MAAHVPAVNAVFLSGGDRETARSNVPVSRGTLCSRAHVARVESGNVGLGGRLPNNRWGVIARSSMRAQSVGCGSSMGEV